MTVRSVPRWDLVSLGEVMLRFDPGEGRIRTARSFDVWEGGGEYNVARGLRRCFDKSTAIVTALADNPVGRLVEDLILQGGVDQSHVVWRRYDDVGRALRNGLNFTERGFGPRGGVGCYDRGHTAVSQLVPGELPWDTVFDAEGARCFHTGGIFASLGEHTREVAAEAMLAAKRRGVRVCYDLNFRPSLWSAIGGVEAAQRVNRELVRHADVLFGNDETFSSALGIEPEKPNPDYRKVDPARAHFMVRRVLQEFPNLSTVASTQREATSASVNLWGAICQHEGQVVEVPPVAIELLDRVGGGDAFASGFIYGLLEERSPQWALECGVSHGALVMSTPGDNSMASLAEVEAHMRGANARMSR